MNSKLGAAASLAMALALSAPVSAHHSYAMFDRTKDVTVSGTVQTWRWGNPHSLLILNAPASDGSPVTWTIESGSAEVLRNRGLTRDVIKVGDTITAHISPLRDGTNGGQLFKLTAADGHEYVTESRNLN